MYPVSPHPDHALGWADGSRRTYRRAVTHLTRRLPVLAAALALALPLLPGTGPAHAASAPQTISSGRTIPWGTAFLPDGTALFTERGSKRVWEAKPGRAAQVVYTVTAARPQGEGGLLGIAVAPDYARNPRFFVYYTTGSDNRVAVVRRGSSARPQPIVTGIPRGSTHNGGRIVFDRDGYLWVGTGDAGDRSRSQDLSSLAGKVLRVDTRGRAAPGNRAGLIYSYGHRNVQGLAQDRTGRMWASELGQNTQDEVNLLQAGGNYGWPLVEGRSDDAHFVAPKWTWRPEEASPSGMTVVGDSLYVAALRGQRVWRLRFSGTTISSATPLLRGTYGRVRDVARNPKDGSVWLLTSNNGLYGAPRPGDDRVLRFARFP